MQYNYLFNTNRVGTAIKPLLLVQCERKWALFGDDVSFEGKIVLDVGCTEGHSCVEAWCRGARFVIGIEREEGWIKVGEKVKERLGIGSAIKFIEKAWEHVNLGDIKFDIVMALGFLHHISVGEYEDLLRKMCYACEETLILESRVDVKEKVKSYIRLEWRPESKIVVAVPSAKYLTDSLARWGLYCEKTYPINVNRREIWVCRRK